MGRNDDGGAPVLEVEVEVERGGWPRAGAEG